MGDKNNNQSQIEKLIEMANELEKRELALSQESKHLESLRNALDERERKLSAAAAKAQNAAAAVVREPVEASAEPVHRERPLVAPRAEKPLKEPVEKPVVKRQTVSDEKRKTSVSKNTETSAQTVTEINDILKSIFWDYSNSVHQISSQLSTVTAAMMCAAVTCVLENRGFDAKDVFMEEMEKMLQGGGLGGVCAAPAKYTRPAPSAPAPSVPAPSVPAPSAPAPSVPAPVAKPQVLDVDDEDENEDEDAKNYTVDGKEADMPQRTEDGVLYIASASEFKKLGEYGFRNDDKLTRVELPEGVEQLPGSFFYGCRNLEEVTLPGSLREIGPYAFYGCESLRIVHISEDSQLREIGEYAFAMCSALQTFWVPATVEILGTSVFRFCSSLLKLTFVKDGNLRRIGSHLLQNCTSLEKLRLPDSITTIPTSMFYGCSALRKVVAKGVDTIEDYAFYGNEALRTIRIRSKKVIAPQAFEGCDPALEIEYLNY